MADLERPLHGNAWLLHELKKTGDKPSTILDKYQTGDVVQKAGGIQKIIQDTANATADRTLEKFRQEQELERQRELWQERTRQRKAHL